MKRILLLAATVIATLAVAPAAGAVTINVNTATDEYGGSPSSCSLREAITAAQTNAASDGCPAGSGPDVISLPSGEYKITRAGADEDANVTGDFDVTGTNALIIQPARSDAQVIVDGNGLDRVFDQQGNNQLGLNNLTIRGGKLTLIEDGAGVRNSAGELSIEGSTLTVNASDYQGGAIAAYSSTTISNSTISGNGAAGNGGGLYVPGGATATVRSSTITENTADADNDGNGYGGGFADAGATSVNFVNTINAGNKDRSAAPENAPDCHSGPFYFPDYTMQVQPFAAGVCLIGFNPGTNKVVPDPMLGPLRDNGGQTPTHALLAGSPAIGAGAPGGPDQCPSKDQIGNDRPIDGCDIGAVQYKAPEPPVKVSVKIAKIAPKKLTLKRGKKAKVSKVTVQSTGAAAAMNVKLCLNKPAKAVKKALKIKGKLCRKLGVLVGKKTVKFKIAAKKGAKKKSYKLKASLTATDAAKKTGVIKVRVK